jgi:hypothetical protein
MTSKELAIRQPTPVRYEKVEAKPQLGDRISAGKYALKIAKLEQQEKILTGIKELLLEALKSPFMQLIIAELLNTLMYKTGVYDDRAELETSAKDSAKNALDRKGNMDLVIGGIVLAETAVIASKAINLPQMVEILGKGAIL